jgi:hypothetical protein
MSEAPKRIWINRVYGQHPEDWDFTDGHHLTKAQLREKVEYIRADLVEAAIKRALEAAASKARFFAELNYAAMNYPEEAGVAASSTAHEIDGDILCLASAPAQFIEEPK